MKLHQYSDIKCPHRESSGSLLLGWEKWSLLRKSPCKMWVFGHCVCTEARRNSTHNKSFEMLEKRSPLNPSLQATDAWMKNQSLRQKSGAHHTAKLGRNEQAMHFSRPHWLCESVRNLLAVVVRRQALGSIRKLSMLHLVINLSLLDQGYHISRFCILCLQLFKICRLPHLYVHGFTVSHFPALPHSACLYCL